MNRKTEHNSLPKVVLNASPCHRQVSRSYSKLYLVEPDGSLTQIGTICYCPFDDFEDGIRRHCLKPLSVGKSREYWPAALDVKRLPMLLRDRGPGYYIRSGFHILRYKGGWQNLHDRPTDGLPPKPPEGTELIPIARAMIEWRVKYGEKPKAPRAKPLVTEYNKKKRSKPKTMKEYVKLENDLNTAVNPPLEEDDGMPFH